jgi:hypothetical protein
MKTAVGIVIGVCATLALAAAYFVWLISDLRIGF